MHEPTDAFEIVTYRPELRDAFHRLNRAWLEAHGLFEPADLKHLLDPEAAFLAGGGQIFFALGPDGEVVGTLAVERLPNGVAELAKLGVTPAARGHGLGRRLCEAALAFARAEGIRRLVLTSNSSLRAALRLYESLGFRYAPLPPDVPYATADVYMEIEP